MAEELLLPPGRLVWGSLYEAQTKNMDGKPLVKPDGVTPRVAFNFGVAIPKAGEQHWKDTAWGAKIWALGHVRVPHAHAMGDDYAWKVKDGDSQKITDVVTGRRACDSEGYPGHWILSLGSGFAPKIYRLNAQNKAEPWITPNAINLGDFIECLVNIADNQNVKNPGIYINHGLVCFAGYGPRIVKQGGPNPDTVGFGARGMVGSATPLSSGAVSAGSTSAPAASAAPVVPPAADAGPPTPPMESAPIEPHPGILSPPTPQDRMLPAAGTHTYAQYIAGGWTEAQLVAKGYMSA